MGPQTKRFAETAGSMLFFILLSVLAGRTANGAATAPDAYDQVRRLGRGLNILGYDPIWDDFRQARFQKKHFKLIHNAGFQTVRINLHALARMDAGRGYKLDPAWLNTLDWAVRGALAAGLAVVLDLHNYNDVALDPEGSKPRILAFWEQVGARFKDAPDSVLFEVLNEPNGKLTPVLWNDWIPELVAAIRKTNPARTLVIGPGFWNGIQSLEDLALPEAVGNVIVTVHYYHPMPFTHQGASWTPQYAPLSGITWGTEKEKAQAADELGRAQKWAMEHKRPIFLGEFGAYDRAPMESRERYTAFVARTAESFGWAWAYWQFDSDFIVYDIDRGRWVLPILRALIPGK